MLDLSFYDFMEVPLRHIERIYDFLDIELTAETRRRMADYLETHTAVQHGERRYAFADFDLDEEEDRERVRPYQTYFEVPSEARFSTDGTRRSVASSCG